MGMTSLFYQLDTSSSNSISPPRSPYPWFAIHQDCTIFHQSVSNHTLYIDFTYDNMIGKQ